MLFDANSPGSVGYSSPEMQYHLASAPQHAADHAADPFADQANRFFRVFINPQRNVGQARILESPNPIDHRVRGFQ